MQCSRSYLGKALVSARAPDIASQLTHCENFAHDVSRRLPSAPMATECGRAAEAQQAADA